MRLAVFFDTETTGLPLFKKPSEHPGQPHIVQLAACLVDMDKRDVIASMDVIIQPDGWTIPDEVAAIHGITTEHAKAVGVPAKLALQMFLELATGRTRIAHNEQFDARLVRIALLRHFNEAVADEWKAGKSMCTQLLATPIVKAPPTAKMLAAGRNHFKSANLGEAVLHFTGEPLENAHSAMADVVGCMDVFFAIQDMQELRDAIPA